VNRLDLKAKIDDGDFAVFEIQFFDQIDFLGKVLFYACRAVVEQVSSGQLFDIKKVYSINIAYFDIGAKHEYVFVASLAEFSGTHFEETIPFSQNLNPFTDVRKDIHPEYFLILPNKFDEQMRGKFDEWVYVLKNSSVKSEFTAAGIQEAGEKLDVIKMTPQERAEYERQRRENMTHKSQMYTAELKGEKRGLEKGEIRGLQTGRAEGEAKLIEQQENTVINCQKQGLPFETISAITGLSIEEIKQILKKHGLI
jgi:predicted transposase/invertase (TIGR01784 family)